MSNAVPEQTDIPSQPKPPGQAALRVEQADSRLAPLWDRYVRGRGDAASAYHLYAWREIVEAAFGHDCIYWMARDADGQVRGVLPTIRLRSRLFGNYAVSLPFVNAGGCLADNDRAQGQLLDAMCGNARELGLDHLELRGFQRLDGAWVLRNDKVVMLLDLPETLDQLWEQLGSKLRSQIKRPLREPVEVLFGGESLLPDFYRVFARNMRDLGTPVYGQVLFRECLRRLPRTEVAVVYLRGHPVAAAFLVGHGERLEIPWASSLREHGRLGVNMLLYWRCLHFALDQGYRVFDFGRCSRNSGTYRFKKQWGARAVDTRWYYWLPDRQDKGGETEQDSGRAQMRDLTPANPRYRLAIRAWRRLPLPMANLLGPHIVKYLP